MQKTSKTAARFRCNSESHFDHVLRFFYSASDTTSIDSEITAYRFENGRRYHAYKDGAY